MKPTVTMRSRVQFFKNTLWLEVSVLAKQVRAYDRRSVNRIGSKRLMHAVRRKWSLEETDDEGKEKQSNKRLQSWVTTTINLKQSLLPMF